MNLKISFDDPIDTQALTRRMLSDLRRSDDIESVDFFSSDAKEGDRGIIQDFTALGIKILEMGGINFIFDALRSTLSIGRPQSDDKRTIILELGEGNRFEMHGGMSDEEFVVTKNRIFSMMEAKVSNDKT